MTVYRVADGDGGDDGGDGGDGRDDGDDDDDDDYVLHAWLLSAKCQRSFNPTRLALTLKCSRHRLIDFGYTLSSEL